MIDTLADWVASTPWRWLECYLSAAVRDLHENEIELLFALADFAEARNRPMSRSALLDGSGLEHAEFVRRLRYLIEIGLVREDRERALTEPGHCVLLTGAGTLLVVAERAVARDLPKPGARSRLSPLAADDQASS